MNVFKRHNNSGVTTSLKSFLNFKKDKKCNKCCQGTESSLLSIAQKWFGLVEFRMLTLSAYEKGKEWHMILSVLLTEGFMSVLGTSESSQ